MRLCGGVQMFDGRVMLKTFYLAPYLDFLIWEIRVIDLSPWQDGALYTVGFNPSYKHVIVLRSRRLSSSFATVLRRWNPPRGCNKAEFPSMIIGGAGKIALTCRHFRGIA